MARIELRDAVIRFKDGFHGTGKVNDLSISDTDTTLGVDTIASLSNNTSIVPVGARFTVVGSTDTYTVTAANSNEVQTVTLTNVDGGHWTLTFGSQTTAEVLYNVSAADLELALEALSNIGTGNVSVTGTPGSSYVVEFTGTLADTNVAAMTPNDVDLTGVDHAIALVTTFPGAATHQLTFTPALDLAGHGLPADDAIITFLSQQLEINVGKGNVTWTESKEYEYELDKGDLDTVREKNEIPMDVKIDCCYEHITTGTSEAISPIDAVKGIGGASHWVTAADDQCEPYAIDVEVYHVPPCGTAQKETILFPAFRADKKDMNIGEATISLAGRCNASEPTVTRTT